MSHMIGGEAGPCWRRRRDCGAGDGTAGRATGLRGGRRDCGAGEGGSGGTGTVLLATGWLGGRNKKERERD